jgi:hypothetical protein
MSAQTMKFLTAALFLALVSPAAAMEDAERKLQDCRANTKSLIGLDRDEVRDKCGAWDRSSINFVDNRRVETLVWSQATGAAAILVIYLGNGKVTAAQSF